MADAADLAHRLLALWEDYLTALLSDPSQVELLRPWVKAAAAVLRDAAPRDPGAAEGDREPQPSARATALADASDGGDDAVAKLARRITDLEARVAALERDGRAASRPRGRNRRVRVR